MTRYAMLATIIIASLQPGCGSDTTSDQPAHIGDDASMPVVPVGDASHDPRLEAAAIGADGGVANEHDVNAADNNVVPADGAADGPPGDATVDASGQQINDAHPDGKGDESVDASVDAADAPGDVVAGGDELPSDTGSGESGDSPGSDANADSSEGSVLSDGGGDAVSDVGVVDSSSACLTDYLVISEIRTRGAGGASDEFIELYNPTSSPVTLDATWKIEARSATATLYTSRWVGTGKTIPAHGHFLLTGTGYTQAPIADEALSAGITDAASLCLLHIASVVDAICFAFNAPTFDGTYTCEGTPASNLPHNDATGAASNSDSSLERKPGSAGGSCTDMGDSASDFTVRTPAAPENAASPLTP